MKKKFLILLSIVAGLGVGALNGLFGGGGGMVAVPVLTYFLQLDTKKSHATAIWVILPISIVSAVIYYLKIRMDFAILIPSAIGVLIGGVVGAFLLSKLSNRYIRMAFSVFMILAGIMSFLR